jgi:hypothetical protein
MENLITDYENDLIDDEYHYDNWIAQNEAYESELCYSYGW